MLLCECAIPLSWDLEPLTVCLVLGETLWSHPSSFSGNVSILSPLLQVPDIDGDGDGTPALLILAQEGQEVSNMFSRTLGPLNL